MAAKPAAVCSRELLYNYDVFDKKAMHQEQQYHAPEEGGKARKTRFHQNS